MFEALLLVVPAPVHEAAVTSNCPADMRALNASAASATTVRLQESPGVGGIMNSTRELAPGEFRFLGVVPLSVDVKAVGPVPKPVSLATIRETPALADFALVRQSRLSVMPVSEEHWAILCRMGGWKGR